MDTWTARQILSVLRGPQGEVIRLAHADNLLGPWRIHVPGSLQLEGSYLLT
jgi:hypothetical protein